MKYAVGGSGGFHKFFIFFQIFRSPEENRAKYLIFHDSVIFSKKVSWPLPSILVSCSGLACGRIHNNIQGPNW